MSRVALVDPYEQWDLEKSCEQEIAELEEIQKISLNIEKGGESWDTSCF